jgi:hypothetical protein
MTTTAFVLLCFAVIFIALAGLLGFSLLWARGKPAPTAEPAPAKRKARGPLLRDTCPYCGECGIPVRRDGEPNLRFHSCGFTKAQAEASAAYLASLNRAEKPIVLTADGAFTDDRPAA